MKLIEEQEWTLAQEPMKYSILSRLLFRLMDMIYGNGINFCKLKVLELIARIPYQAWEKVGYSAITHTHNNPKFAKTVFKFVEEARQQQDNEQWHLLIVRDIITQKKIKTSWLLHTFLPLIIAMTYYPISWLTYVIYPRLSYRLNAEFEDHAERSYMQFIADNPDFENQRVGKDITGEYGTFESLAHLLRQIALDERHHKEESLARMKKARFGIFEFALNSTTHKST